ncbi:MAG: hypothetical protein ACFB2Z_05040 [Maricaulaceae bacterium]
MKSIIALLAVISFAALGGCASSNTTLADAGQQTQASNEQARECAFTGSRVRRRC